MRRDAQIVMVLCGQAGRERYSCQHQRKERQGKWSKDFRYGVFSSEYVGSELCLGAAWGNHKGSFGQFRVVAPRTPGPAALGVSPELGLPPHPSPECWVWGPWCSSF